MKAQQKSPPRETQGLPGLFAASNTGRPFCKFYRHSFCGPAHMQHIAFLFSIEKGMKEKTKNQRAAPPAKAKTCARKTCPKLHYIMWPYITPRKAKRCAGRTEKPAGYIRTLCKIAARGADAFVRLSLRSVKAGATGVRIFF